MNNLSSVSSLYGPGAFACWLCTVISVLVSWVFNRVIRKRDSIGNDFVAALTLPSIAVAHLIYNLCQYEQTEDETLIASMDAAYSICVSFSTFGIWMLLSAHLQGKVKRWTCTAVVSFLCIAVRLVLPVRRDLPAKLPAYTCSVLDIFAPLSYPAFIPMGDAVSNPNRPETYKFKSCRAWTSAVIRWGFPTVMVLSLGAVAMALFEFSTAKDGIAFPFPHTSDTLRELDQAVALGAGLMTLVCSILDALASRTAPAWENYLEWRASREAYLEGGVLEASEASKWERELMTIDQKAKDVLEAPTNAGLVSTSEIKRRREAERLMQSLSDSVFI